jgi:hypothetical protein
LTRESPSNLQHVDAGSIAPNKMERPTSKPIKSHETVFKERLIPLLSNESFEELKRDGSSQSLALNWILYQSNSTDFSFDRRVQLFAMAVLYHSTGGASWKEN